VTEPLREQVPTALGRLATTVHNPSSSGIPLVLTHGIFLDSTLWDAVVDAVDDRPVLTVDGPGHGGSGDPAGGWSLEQHADALLAVLDHYGMDRAVLAGHSWGGMTSLRLALARPERVSGLGLFNTPLTRQARAVRAGFRAQQLLLTVAGPSRFYGRQAAVSLYDPASLRRRPELAHDLAERLRSLRGRALSRAVSAVILRPVEMVEQLSRVAAPVSVVAGATDYVLPPETRRAVARALPGAVIHIVDGGHVSPHEDPRATELALRDLLSRAAGAELTGA
jgi:pimeloyl-ACP methyl ester carboxylesterase